MMQIKIRNYFGIQHSVHQMKLQNKVLENPSKRSRLHTGNSERELGAASSRQVAGTTLVKPGILELNHPEDKFLQHFSWLGLVLYLVAAGERQVMVVLWRGD